MSEGQVCEGSDPRELLQAGLESAWRSGHPVQVEKLLLTETVSTLSDDTLLHLIKVEIMLRKENGQSPSSEEYADRFPNLKVQIFRLFEVAKVNCTTDDVASSAHNAPIKPAPDLTLSCMIRNADGRLESPIAGRSNDTLAMIFHGAVLDGRYILEQELGRGGMGVVYSGRDSRLDRRIAVKAILPPTSFQSLEDETYARTLFEQEARLGAALLHPAIATVFDYGFHEGKPYTVFEYIPGETLRDVLVRRGRFPLEEVQEILSNLAKALDYAHANYIVHRDLKPENIRVTDQSQYKILDLGLAKRFTHNDGWHFAGTPAYASPEQAAGEPSDGRTDQYALAVITYELLTGTRPFVSNNVFSLLEKHRRHVPPSPKLNVTDLPEHVSLAILRALEKSPANRYDSCLQFAAAVGCKTESGGTESSRIDLVADVRVNRLNIYNKFTLPFVLKSRRQKYGRIALTDNDFWLSHRGEIYVWPLAQFNFATVDNRLTLNPHSISRRNYLSASFDSESQCNEWQEAIKQRQSKLEEPDTDSVEVNRENGHFNRPPLIWLLNRPIARCQFLGAISARAKSRSMARAAIRLEAAVRDADAVTEIEEERFTKANDRGWRISAIPVRALSEEARIEMGSQQFAGEIGSLSIWMLSYSMIMLLIHLSSMLFLTISAASMSPADGIGSYVLGQLMGWGPAIAISVVLRILRWPEAARPSALFFLGLGVIPQILSLCIVFRVLTEREHSISGLVAFLIASLLWILFSQFSKVLTLTVPCVLIAWNLWGIWRRTRHWHCRSSPGRRLFGIALGIFSTVYVSVLWSSIIYSSIASRTSAGIFESESKNKRGYSALQNHDYRSAYHAFDESLRIDPSNSVARMGRAQAAYYHGMKYIGTTNAAHDFEESEKDINILIAKNANNSEAHTLMGKIHEARGDVEAAIGAYSHAIRIDPNEAEALFARGVLRYDKQRDFERAASDFDTVLNITPNDGHAFYNRALCHKELGNSIKAKEDFEKAKELGVDSE